MNSSAKPFFVFLCFIAVIALFAGGLIGETDLTPDTPPAPSSSTTNFNSAVVQGSWSGGGVCSGTYTVQSGDTLSKIARLCGVDLNALIAANAHLGDPNMIRPGQVLYLPSSTGAYVPDSGGSASPAGTTTPSGGIPDTGLLTEKPIDVEMVGFPPNAKVQVGLGREGEPPVSTVEKVTGSDGKLVFETEVPATAQEGERWVVTVTTVQEPQFEVASQPFVIGPR